MNPYVQAAMQCYAKATAHIENEVLPAVTDPQTRQGLKFLVEHGKKEVENIQKAASLSENGSSF